MTGDDVAAPYCNTRTTAIVNVTHIIAVLS